jgi:hypothetical protein
MALSFVSYHLEGQRVVQRGLEQTFLPLQLFQFQSRTPKGDLSRSCKAYAAEQKDKISPSQSFKKPRR